MQVGHRLLARTPAQIGMHSAALDRPWPHDGHLDGDVFKAGRLEPRQHLLLRPAFHLEGADRVACLQHLVDLRVVQWNSLQVRRLCRPPACSRANVSLITPSVRSASRSILISPASSTLSLSHWQTKRPGMVAGSSGTISASGAPVISMPPLWMERWRGQPSIWRSRVTRCGRRHPFQAAPQLRAGECVSSLPNSCSTLVLGQFEHLAQVAHGAARLVGDHVADHGSVAVAVLAVDILDHLLTAVGGKVDVDVGHCKLVAAQETLEQQVVCQRIDAGDAQQVGDDGVGGRAAPLAANPLLAGKPHDVPHDQEVGRQAGAFDDVQFVRQLLEHHGPQVWVALRQACMAELVKKAERRRTIRRGKLRQALLRKIQRYLAAFGDCQRVVQGIGLLHKTACHLGAATAAHSCC